MRDTANEPVAVDPLDSGVNADGWHAAELAWPCPTTEAVRPAAELVVRPPMVLDAVIGSRTTGVREPRRWLRPLLMTLLAVVVLAVLAVLVWLAVQAVLSLIATAAVVVAWVKAHLLLIGLGTTVLLVLLLRSRAGSSCAGCTAGGCGR